MFFKNYFKHLGLSYYLIFFSFFRLCVFTRCSGGNQEQTKGYFMHCILRIYVYMKPFCSTSMLLFNFVSDCFIVCRIRFEFRTLNPNFKAMEFCKQLTIINHFIILRCFFYQYSSNVKA